MRRLIKFTLIISLLSVVLSTHIYAADDEWLANEVLTQLADIRRNMTGLKNEIQNLRKEVDALKAKTSKKRKSLNISSLLKDKGGKLGDKNARIAVIEFTDYQCPYCARHVRKTLENLKLLN